ncbi:MAG: response regulator [Thermodesulfobacteriota bacterium]
MKKKKNTIVIAEDHQILQQGLCSLLNGSDDLEVVGVAGDGMEAVQSTVEKVPDLLLLDLNMPRMNGLSVILEIKRQCPHTKVLALTMHREEDFIFQAFQAGADGYCLKSADYEELLQAIRSVLSGKNYVSPEISGTVLEGYLDDRKTIRKKSPWETLTRREREVLRLVGEGCHNKNIADYLSISVKTVEKHRGNIMDKLDIHTAPALTAYAIEKGMVKA